MDRATWRGALSRDPKRIILGSAQWGMPYGIANQLGQPSRDGVDAILAVAEAAGIQTIDCARAYGESEAILGRSERIDDRWRVITKLAPDVDGGDQELGLGEVLERTLRSLDESRAALAQDALPVVLLHRFAHRHACGGRVWRMLLAERDAGRIGFLGVSAANPEEAWAALDDPNIEVLQVAASLLDLRLERQGFFQRARELGRTVHVRSVFLQGVAHLDPARLPSALEPLAEPMRQIRSRAAELGVAPRVLYLGYARELAGVRPILGCESAGQLSQLLGDWASERVGPPCLGELVDELPIVAEECLDPSRWPQLTPGSGRSPNQTPAPGIANIPP